MRNAPGSPGGTRRAAPVRGDLREASDVTQHERLPERERGEEHTRLVDLAVGQRDDVGAPHQRRDLAIGDEPLDEAHPGRRAGLQGRGVHPRHADDPQLGVVDPAPRVDRDVDALVRAHQPEQQDDRLVDGRQLGGQRNRIGNVEEMGERAVRDHRDARGIDTRLLHEPAAAVLGVHDDRIEAGIEAALGRQLPAPRLARQHVVRGQDERAASRQQVRVELLHRQPLEVHDVRRERPAPVAQHVRDVAREAGDGARAARCGHAAVERRVDVVPLGGGHGPVGEVAREQGDVGARARERGAQRVVVRAACTPGGRRREPSRAFTIGGGDRRDP